MTQQEIKQETPAKEQETTISKQAGNKSAKISIEQEYQQLLASNELEQNTKNLLAKLKQGSRGLFGRAIKKAEGNFSITTTDMKTLNSALLSANVSNITIHKESGNIKYSLYNSFVFMVMSIVSKANYQQVYNAIGQDYGLLSCFIETISDTTKNRPEQFINRL